VQLRRRAQAVFDLEQQEGYVQDGIDDAMLETYELSAPELFKARLLLDGVHFTIMACEYGTQSIAPSDQPFGIIPALLHAGATSVLGYQWPIDSRAGQAFSEAFYNEFNCGDG
jgi:hypothetical protein